MAHVLGDYWHSDRDERTELGRLVAAAKDHGDPAALDELCHRLGLFAAGLDLPAEAVVVPVPAAPDRPGIVQALAAAVAERCGLPCRGLLALASSPPRMRDTPPRQRPDAVAGAGYSVAGTIGGPIVVVDDVILTGSTLDHLSRLLSEAGASRVDAVVVCRSRLAS